MFIKLAAEQADDGEIGDWFDQQRASWGYLPNYAPAFASRPDVARAWSTLNITIRQGMDRRRYEIATIAAARVLRSTYCTAAHSKFLRDVCDDERALRAMMAEPAALDATDLAVMRFAEKVAIDAASVGQADVDELREHGLTDADVANVVFAVAARSFFTRVLDGLGVQADHQLGATFDPELREHVTVGRPIAAEPS